MAIEMRQQMKLTQQLVMTPQLQQAIKLLQLSRIELQDVVRQELEENPVLDEALEEEVREPDQLEMLEKEHSPEETTEEFKEVKAGEDTLSEMDWDNYLDGYNFSSSSMFSPIRRPNILSIPVTVSFKSRILGFTVCLRANARSLRALVTAL